MINSRHRGKHYARTTRLHNSEELRFADEWEKLNKEDGPESHHRLLEYLLGNGCGKLPASDRDCEVAATVIQWLGTEIGQDFLKSLGYIKEKLSG